MKSILKIISFLFLNHLLVAGITGKLMGTVTDLETNAPLIGCNIIIDGTYFGTSSNENGEYIMLNVPPNKYTVRFEMIGYKKLVSKDVNIYSDKTTKLNGILEPSVIEGDEITVVAERKLIQFDVTQSEAIITSEELEGMPVTEVSEVLRLQGGVTVD